MSLTIVTCSSCVTWPMYLSCVTWPWACRVDRVKAEHRLVVIANSNEIQHFRPAARRRRRVWWGCNDAVVDDWRHSKRVTYDAAVVGRSVSWFSKRRHRSRQRIVTALLATCLLLHPFDHPFSHDYPQRYTARMMDDVCIGGSVWHPIISCVSQYSVLRFLVMLTEFVQ